MADDFSNLDLDSLVVEPVESLMPAGAVQTVPNGATATRRIKAPPLANSSRQDVGRGDGLRSAVLGLVTEGEYERAIVHIERYEDYKTEYPQFKARAGRYMGYACDLIKAIKAKRSFPGVRYLNMAKQRELYERAQDHFDDLIATLKKVEKIEMEVHAEDGRSTIWVLKAGCFAVMAVLTVAFLKEVSHGVLPAAAVVLDDAFTRTANFLFEILGY